MRILRDLVFTGTALAGAAAAPSASAADAAPEPAFQQMLQRDFRAKGVAGLDRLAQDDVQRLCAATRDRPEPSERQRGLREQSALIRWPADGRLLGDWRAGEKLAQDGRGMTWTDRAGGPVGGSCYACHQLSSTEIAYGTIGPSLLGLGRQRGASLEMQKYVYGHIYNAKAYNLCSYMPRFGVSGALTEQQIKDLVALLLDPESPVNRAGQP
jgi:L-cysteine S-thiosulfotransferase